LTKPRTFYEKLAIELAAKRDRTTKERAWLGRGHFSLGRILLILGRHAESERELQAALRIYEALERDHPGIPEYQGSLAGSHYTLGNVFGNTGRVEEAEEAYGKAIAEYERLVREHPEYQARLATGHNSLGLVLDRTGRAKEAEEAYGR